jgi:cell division protein FtsW
MPLYKKIKKFDRRLFFITIFLCVAGLIVLSSASTVLSYQRFGYNTYYLTRQAIAVIVGLILMFLLSRVDYRLFKKYSTVIILGAALLLLLVLIPGIGLQVGNARRWINLGFYLLQPSEFAKLALIFYLAAWYDTRGEYVRGSFFYLLGPLAVTGIIAGLVIFEPDFGSMTSLLLIALAVIVASPTRLSHILTLAGLGLGLGWGAVTAAPYRLERILTFFNPNSDPLGAGYQINQALLAIGSGGILGYGFGQSRQKFNFLPEPIGDSIFAVMSEELGFLRVLVVLAAFLAFALVGFSIARRAPDTFGRLVAAGVTMWVVIQVCLNIGAMVNILPLTGIPLPFISNGGSSILALLCGVGVMLNISRKS